MRIVISSAPKMGNHWIKCLLAQVYDVEWLPGKAKAANTRPDSFRRWVAAGEFPDGSIFHQHCRFNRWLADEIEAAGAHLVTIVRNPYDAFVSLYYWVQERDARALGRRQTRPRNELIGKPLDDPDVLRYIAGDFRANLTRANSWLQSGRAVVVRYEGLHADPIGELRRATEQIAPVPTSRLEAAVEACRADNMRQLSERMQWHVRSAKTGDSRERLSDAHLRVFREKNADLISALGYEVR